MGYSVLQAVKAALQSLTAVRARSSPKIRSNPYSVLVVDDDSVVRESTAAWLERSGFRVVQASNGLDAFHLLKRTGAPRAILLDLDMPILDGTGFRELQVHNPTLAGVPIIVVTADDNRQAPKWAVGFLKKPVDPVKLAEDVKRCCDGS
jgi:CheY-like chemotaxis protein